MLDNFSKRDKDILFKGVAVGSVVTLVVALGAVSVSQGIHMFSMRDVSHINNFTDVIEDEYYKSVSKKDLLKHVYNGLFSGLDEYSCYFSPEEYAEMNRQKEKNYCGVGITYTLSAYTSSFVILNVVEGSPAHKAGIKIGDILTEVDGVKLKDKKLDKVKMLMTGKKGTSVDVRVNRGTDELEFTMIRDNVKMVNCKSYNLTDDIGYIYIQEFGGEVVKEFNDCLSAVGGRNKVIIDLRGNPGGEIDALMEILSKICPDGLVTTLLYSNGEKHEYKLTGGVDGIDRKFVVLVNDSSASCSEIMAAFMQENGYATVIGHETYGKGVVQWLHELTDGSAFKLTVASYRTSKGVDLGSVGVMPDIETDTEFYMLLSKEEALQDNDVKRAIKVLEGAKSWKGM